MKTFVWVVVFFYKIDGIPFGITHKHTFITLATGSGSFQSEFYKMNVTRRMRRK